MSLLSVLNNSMHSRLIKVLFSFSNNTREAWLLPDADYLKASNIGQISLPGHDTYIISPLTMTHDMIQDWSEFSFLLEHADNHPHASFTLYPEDLMWTPLLVSVDFIRTKKERSRELSGDRRLGLLDSTAETNNKHPITTLKQYTTHRDAEISDCFSESDVQ